MMKGLLIHVKFIIKRHSHQIFFESVNKSFFMAKTLKHQKTFGAQVYFFARNMKSLFAWCNFFGFTFETCSGFSTVKINISLTQIIMKVSNVMVFVIRKTY